MPEPSLPPPTSARGLEPGATIDGVWVIEAMLGSGGMGSVFRCHNVDAPRMKAAIKLLGDALQKHPEARARFLQEAELLSTLAHPNVVRVSSVRLSARPPYIEMELVNGTALENILERGAPERTQALAWFRQMIDALRYLHEREIFHRDIKPQNLLIDQSGTLKVVDFGLAQEEGGDRITKQGTRFGTASYSPPEWADTAVLSGTAWDLYAAGVVAWEMLTGKQAFPVDLTADPMRQTFQVMSAKADCSELDPGPDVPRGLRDLIREMTANDPSRRPASAAEVLARFDASQTSAPGMASKAAVPVAAASLAGGGLLVGIGLAVLLAAGLAWVLWPAADNRPSTVFVPVAAEVRAPEEPSPPEVETPAEEVAEPEALAPAPVVPAPVPAPVVAAPVPVPAPATVEEPEPERRRGVFRRRKRQ